MKQSNKTGNMKLRETIQMKISTLSKHAVVAITTALAVVSFGSPAKAGFVDLGAAGSFDALALTHGIDSSGPLGPDGNYTFAGNVGVASAGQKFQASGSVNMSGKLFLHTGDTYNSSAKGVAQPQPQNAANDAFLAQARSDAFKASAFASSLAATASLWHDQQHDEYL